MFCCLGLVDPFCKINQEKNENNAILTGKHLHYQFYVQILNGPLVNNLSSGSTFSYQNDWYLSHLQAVAIYPEHYLITIKSYCLNTEYHFEPLSCIDHSNLSKVCS